MTKKDTTIEKHAHKYCPEVKLGCPVLPSRETLTHIFAPKINLDAHFFPKANLKNVFQTKLNKFSELSEIMMKIG